MVKIPMKIFVEETEQLEHVYASRRNTRQQNLGKELSVSDIRQLHSWLYTPKLLKWAGSETWEYGKVLDS